MLGVIFDWDGVVIDSADLHEKSWEILADETGFTLPPDHFELGFEKEMKPLSARCFAGVKIEQRS